MPEAASLLKSGFVESTAFEQMTDTLKIRCTPNHVNDEFNVLELFTK